MRTALLWSRLSREPGDEAGFFQQAVLSVGLGVLEKTNRIPGEVFLDAAFSKHFRGTYGTVDSGRKRRRCLSPTQFRITACDNAGEQYPRDRAT